MPCVTKCALLFTNEDIHVLLFQSIHESFLRTVPSYSDQANVWLGLLNYFGWFKVILVTSNDQDSRMIATRFTGLAERSGIKVIECLICAEKRNTSIHLVQKALLRWLNRVIARSRSARQ